jgi:hypothetical protein
MNALFSPLQVHSLAPLSDSAEFPHGEHAVAPNSLLYVDVGHKLHASNSVCFV